MFRLSVRKKVRISIPPWRNINDFRLQHFSNRFWHCQRVPITRVHGCVVISEEEGRRHRIAFNSLYLFSFRSIIYEANGEELYNFTRGVTVSCLSNPYAASTVSTCFLCLRAIVSGRRGLHDMWYNSDWLVLSARLLVQPSCGQVKIVQNIYICLVMFPCGYVRILQPVAICTVIFVTVVPSIYAQRFWGGQKKILYLT